MATIGNRYNNQIKYWEIWNEADYYGYYSGSIDELVLLTQTASQELKSININNEILSPNFTSAKMLAEFIYENGDDFTDIISWHHYPTKEPEKSIYEIIGIRNLMEKWYHQQTSLEYRRGSNYNI